MRPHRDKNGKRMVNRNVQIVLLTLEGGILCLWCVCVCVCVCVCECTHALAGLWRRGSPKGSLRAVKMKLTVLL